LAAAVKIEGRSEVLHRHRGALDVPPGPTLAPWAVPRRLAGLRALPEREIARVALALVHLDAGAGPELVEIFPGQPPVRGEAADSEVDVALDRVGVPGGDQLLDESDHLAHVLGRLRV